MVLQFLQVIRNVADEFFVQASKVIAFNACVAECDGCLDDVLEFTWIGEASVLADNLEEQSRVSPCNFELGQETVQNRLRDFLQVFLRVSVEIDN